MLVPAAAGSENCLDCTPDELASLVREIQDSSLVKTHTYHLKGYKNSFVARDLVTWMVEQKKLPCELFCVCVHFTSLSPSFHLSFSFISPLFLLHFTSLSPSFHLSFSFISPLFLLHFTSLSPSFHLSFSFISPLFLLHFTSLSPSFHLSFSFISPLFLLHFTSLFFSFISPLFLLHFTSLSPSFHLSLFLLHFTSLSPSFHLSLLSRFIFLSPLSYSSSSTNYLHNI